MKEPWLIIISILGGVSTGCAAHFNGSAPAHADGSYYVVGMYQAGPAADAAVWICPPPSAKTRECKRVTVVEQ
jgi:hypothetical protein